MILYRSRDFESWHDKNGGQRCENTFAAGVRVGCVADCGARDRDGYYTYDAKGRLVRWPNKFTVQRLAMWTLWTHFDGRRLYTEREVNEVLKAWHTYGDHVTLRRELINHRLLTRKSDCSEYRKLPARPDEETRWFLHAWRRISEAARRPRERPTTAAPAATGEGQR